MVGICAIGDASLPIVVPREQWTQQPIRNSRQPLCLDGDSKKVGGKGCPSGSQWPAPLCHGTKGSRT